MHDRREVVFAGRCSLSDPNSGANAAPAHTARRRAYLALAPRGRTARTCRTLSSRTCGWARALPRAGRTQTRLRLDVGSPRWCACASAAPPIAAAPTSKAGACRRLAQLSRREARMQRRIPAGHADRRTTRPRRASSRFGCVSPPSRSSARSPARASQLAAGLPINSEERSCSAHDDSVPCGLVQPTPNRAIEQGRMQIFLSWV